MESEEITKLVDGVYKNILEKFNPGARQLITAGKGYLKALHGAASASRLFNEALAKIAMNAQQSGTGDIGAALLNVVSVYKEIQEQQMNILKAFYVDLLVPLETNLEKDTKVVQHEQKKFMQQHKVRMESYHKAMSTMKKQRKKKSSPENTEKELRSLQILEDQKKKLDAFCEQSYKNAMTQERRRYGFVLERQCSIAKHWVVYHNNGKAVIDNSLESWQEIASSREVIPPTAYETNYAKRMERMKEDHVGGHMGGGGAQLKKARSVDAPYGDMRTLHENTISNSVSSYAQNSLPRAKSDFNLTTTSSNDNWDQRPVVRALYAYMPSGENQLPLEEGDKIALVGNKAKGWQFGENLRTQMFGWFPIAYTNAEDGEAKSTKASSTSLVEHEESYENVHFQRNNGGGGGGATGGAVGRNYHDSYMSESLLDPAMESDSTYRRRNHSAEESSPTRMFGDTMNLRNQKKYRGTSGVNPRPGPPPTLPAPVPAAASSMHASRMLNTSQSFCTPNGNGGGAGGAPMTDRRSHKSGQAGPQAAHAAMMSSHSMAPGGGASSSKQAAAAKTSLHSSNDSGFANEPPPQPEVDYSDEEQSSRVPIRRRADTNSRTSPRGEVSSWTLNRNFRNSVDSQIDDDNRRRHGGMRYDTMIASDDEILQASGSSIKRTKSFWKFGRHDDDAILAGMSLWQHRDLVVAPKVSDDTRHSKNEVYRQRSDSQLSDHEDEDERVESADADRNGTLTKSNSNHSHSSSSNEKQLQQQQRKDSVTSMEMYDDDENIYGISPVGMQSSMTTTAVAQPQRSATTAMHANYTPKSRMKIMKTIEIDIENPTENERLSTIKRGQKEYQKETALLQQRQEATLKKQQQQTDSKNRNPTSNNQAKKGNNMMDQKSNHHLTSQKQKQPQQQHKQHHQQQQQRTNPMDMLHSTEDEGESDDNGTLKMSDVNNFFDDMPHEHDGGAGGGMIMKTVKRKDILKQYYSSEDESDDVELKSTSSDPYDCIVINDHLVRSKEEKQRRQVHNSYHQEHQLEFQTFRAASTATTPTMTKSKSSKSSNAQSSGKQRHHQADEHHHQQQQQQQHDRYNGNSGNNTLTRSSVGNSSAMSTPTATILPRTRLMKSSNTTSMTLERTQPHSSSSSGKQLRENGGDRSDKEHRYSKTYGPWYDFWDPQEQHTLVSQKSGHHSKMK